jgi:hypothetical protein
LCYIITMKLLILAVLLAIQTGPPVPGKTSGVTDPKGHSLSQHPENNRAALSQSPSSVNARINTPSNESSGHEGSRDQTQQSIKVGELPLVSIKKDPIDWGVWLFSFLLVVVGILQWCVLRSQAKIMRAHATHLKNLAIAAKDNAEAARSNAQAFIRTQRPWVIVEFEQIDILDKKTYPAFHIFATNYGKSPARVISYTPNPDPIVCNSPDNLPLPYPTSSSVLSVERFLPQGKRIEIGDFRPLAPENVAKWADWIAARGTERKPTLVIYGEIIYTDDITPEPYKTRFCYSHTDRVSANTGGTLIWRGPSEYNRYT